MQPGSTAVLSTTQLRCWSCGVPLNSDYTMHERSCVAHVPGKVTLLPAGVDPSSVITSAVPNASDLGKSLGKKHDGGKAPLAQGCIGYFRNALEAVAKISEYGAKKYKVDYSDQAWRLVPNARGRYMDAMARHLAAYAAGEQNDPESGLPHTAHAAWNALALIELEKEANDKSKS